MTSSIAPGPHDALLVVDVQNDFLPGGALGVAGGDRVIAPLNAAIEAFVAAKRPIYATRDWHTPDHCSFKPQGGPWPPHCIAHSHGAQFAAALRLPASAVVISKATTRAADAYSGFEGTDLAERLAAQGIRRVFVGGLTTDYCVLHTALDARAAGLEVVVLEDAVRAVNAAAKDGAHAIERIRASGATLLRS